MGWGNDTDGEDFVPILLHICKAYSANLLLQ